MQAREEMQHNSKRHKGPQHVDQHGRGARAAPEDGQEMRRVEAASAALAFIFVATMVFVVMLRDVVGDGWEERGRLVVARAARVRVVARHGELRCVGNA